MVEKARSNLFTVFMRKIGYSVGLEHTLDRLTDFARMYASQEVLGYADINRLLHADKPIGWGLDKNNEHILDVFRSLGVIDVRKGEVAVLELGDSLGILKRLVESEGDFLVCAKLLFAHALVLADGDIFLNALAASFEPAEFDQRIRSLIEYKWTVLERHFVSAQQRNAIYAAVNIEAQINNPGSRGKGLATKTLDPMRLRTSRGSLSSATARPDIYISDPYLSKALPRRKAWAVSLGLATDDGTPTTEGIALINALVTCGYAGPACVVLWPLEHELSSPTFANMKSVEFPVLSSWDFLTLVGRGLGALPSNLQSPGEEEQVFKTLSRIISIFKDLNKSKSILRTELPVRVAYQCIAGLAAISGSLPELPDMLAKEQRSPSPRIIARPSRLAEFALSN